MFWAETSQFFSLRTFGEEDVEKYFAILELKMTIWDLTRFLFQT
jgi:hypothetical protein